MLFAEYNDVGYRILARVVAENLWRIKNNEGGKIFETYERVVNKEKVVQIAREEIEKLAPQTKFQIPDYENLNKIAQQSVEDFIEYCQKVGLLNGDIINLTNKLTKTSDIQVAEMSFSGGLNIDLRYNKNVFPVEGEKRPQLLINELIIQGRMSRFTKLIENLDESKLLEISLGSVAIHEWSHSIENAIALQFTEIGRSSAYYDEKEDYFKVINKSHDLIFEYAKGIVHPVVENFQDYRNSNELGMHIERFATGFEMIGFDFMGFIDLKNKIIEQKRNKLDEFKKLRQELEIPDFDLTYLAMDVKTVIKEAGVESNDIPSIWQDLGYLVPYTQNELKIMISKACNYLQNKEDIFEELFGYKQALA